MSLRERFNQLQASQAGAAADGEPTPPLPPRAPVAATALPAAPPAASAALPPLPPGATPLERARRFAAEFAASQAAAGLGPSAAAGRAAAPSQSQGGHWDRRFRGLPEAAPAPAAAAGAPPAWRARPAAAPAGAPAAPPPPPPPAYSAALPPPPAAAGAALPDEDLDGPSAAGAAAALAATAAAVPAPAPKRRRAAAARTVVEDDDESDDGGGGGSGGEAGAPRAAPARRVRARAAAASDGEAEAPEEDLDALLALPAAGAAVPVAPIAAAAAAAAEDEPHGDWRIAMDEHGADFVVPPPGGAAGASGAGRESQAAEPFLEVVVPGSIAGRLRDYQRAGVRFLLGRYAAGSGGVLADEMGLGKTLQSVAVIAAILGKRGDPAGDTAHPPLPRLTRVVDAPVAEEGRRGRTAGTLIAADPRFEPGYAGAGAPILIVCPSSLVDNWRQELDKWGTFRAVSLRGASREGALAGVVAGRYEIAVATYDTVTKAPFSAAVAEVPWHAVFFDEAHFLKNQKTSRYAAADALPTRMRFGLTGTPMQNRFDELFALLHLLVPGALGPSAKSFETAFGRPIKLGQRRGASQADAAAGDGARRALRARLEPVMLRRNKSVIATSMPRLVHHVVFVELADVQMAAYRRVLAMPDVDLLQRAHEPCPCGAVNDLTHARYKKCQCPGDGPFSECPRLWRATREQGGVFWPRYHLCECDNAEHPLTNPDGCRYHRPEGCFLRGKRQCPWCLCLPLIQLLQAVGNHLELVKAPAPPRPGSVVDSAARRKCAWQLEVAGAVLGEDAAALGGVVEDPGSLRLSDARTCGKMVALRALLKGWAEDTAGDGGLPHRVLIFSRSVRMLQIVRALCEDAGHELAYLDGQTPGAARQGIVDAFNAPGSRTFAFLVSTHAGGVGLNIAAANRVVIVDPDWSPAKDLQAMARAFRIGQRRAVRVYRLVAAGTIEERMYARQLDKQLSSEAAVEGAEGAGRVFEGAAVKGYEGELYGMLNLLRHEREELQTAAAVAARGVAGGAGGAFRVERDAALEAAGGAAALLARGEGEGGGGGAGGAGTAVAAGDVAGEERTLRALGAVAGIMRHDAALERATPGAAAAAAAARAAFAAAARAAGAAVAAALARGAAAPPAPRAAAAAAARRAALAPAAARCAPLAPLGALARALGVPRAALAADLLRRGEGERRALLLRYKDICPDAGLPCAPP